MHAQVLHIAIFEHLSLSQQFGGAQHLYLPGKDHLGCSATFQHNFSTSNPALGKLSAPARLKLVQGLSHDNVAPPLQSYQLGFKSELSTLFRAAMRPCKYNTSMQCVGSLALKPLLKMSSVSTSSSELCMVAATRPFSVTIPSSSTYLQVATTIKTLG